MCAGEDIIMSVSCAELTVNILIRVIRDITYLFQDFPDVKTREFPFLDDFSVFGSEGKSG